VDEVESGTFDVVVVEERLLGSVNGWTLCEELQRIRQGQRVMLMTDSTDAVGVGQLARQGIPVVSTKGGVEEFAGALRRMGVTCAEPLMDSAQVNTLGA
jgi:hypothetical protein